MKFPVSIGQQKILSYVKIIPALIFPFPKIEYQMNDSYLLILLSEKVQFLNSLVFRFVTSGIKIRTLF